MTATDNAFIRAYTRRADQAHPKTNEKKSHAHKVRPISVGAESGRTSEIVVASNPSEVVDQLVAGAGESIGVALPRGNPATGENQPRPAAARNDAGVASAARRAPRYRHDTGDNFALSSTPS